MRGQRLNFIQNNDALGNMMHFPAATCAIGEQAFKELNGRRDDQRRVPILRIQLSAADPARFPPASPASSAAVAARSFRSVRSSIAEWCSRTASSTENFTEFSGSLVNDTRVGNGVNDA